MNTPEWLIPGLVGATLGGVAVGFVAAGWMTGASAGAMAQQMGHDRDLADSCLQVLDVPAN